MKPSSEIRYLASGLIDREEWDSWVRGSANRRIYSSSLFLDIFSPGWEALVAGNGDVFMPLTRNRKWGITYLFQPIFVQQLGCFYREGISCNTKEFLDRAHGLFRFADISMNEMNDPGECGYRSVKMTNYLLNLDRPYEQMVAGYDKNTLRNIQKAGRLRIELRPHNMAGDIVRLFAGSAGRNYPNIRRVNYIRLQNLLEKGLDEGFIEIRGAFSTRGRILAALCMLEDYDRYVFYFSANTEEGRKYGAMFMLLDSFLKQYAGKGRVFDFNGSVNPGTARFYMGFGARAVIYHRIRMNRLRFPANRLKR